jgi:hypothetical protein
VTASDWGLGPMPEQFFYFISFLWDCCLNTGLSSCKAGTLPLEPHLQSIFALPEQFNAGILMICLSFGYF